MKPVRKNTDPLDPKLRLNRIQWSRTSRPMVGLALSKDFATVTAAMLFANGWGKYLKFNAIECISHQLPDQLAESARKLIGSKNQSERPTSVHEFEQLSYDLTEQLHRAIEMLRAQVNNVANDLLIVAVTEPGVWHTDFDGQVFCTAICNGQHLAQLSGLSVVDSFPQTDLAVGGNGQNLDALPLWFLLADRKEPIATQTRVLVAAGQRLVATVLPQSDGLDSEFPLVTRTTLAVSELPVLAQKSMAMTVGSTVEIIAETNEIFEELGALDFDNDSISVSLLDDVLCPSEQLGAMTAAVKAAFFVDQVPSNLPWITECEVPRILGRISPGRPSCWRRLIEQMADYRPAAMKLREAI